MEKSKIVKSIRKALGLSQLEFGKPLAVGNKAVSAWESGRQDIPDSKFTLICALYHVREEWLETGKGEIFEPPQEAQTIDDAARQLGADATTVAIVTRFFALPPEKQKLFVDLLQELLSGVRVVPNSPSEPSNAIVNNRVSGSTNVRVINRIESK